VTTQVDPCLFTRRAVSEGDMVISDVVEEVNFFLLQKQPSSNRVDRSISPSFIEETTILV